jgi:hypothetical protein
MKRHPVLPVPGLSRRAILGRAAAVGAALGLGSRLGRAAAQDATPTPMAGHPLVGTWIVDRNPDDPTEIPTYNVLTADGGLIDPTQGGAGLWEATGPDTANFGLTGTIAELGAYFVVRGTLTVDAGGGTATAAYSSTIVAADGTVLDQLTEAQGTARYVRFRIEPQDAVGQPLAGFPAWEPAPVATPTP